MTVVYSLLVATASWRSFLRIFTWWRGSLWKLVYRECIVWSLIIFGHLGLFLFVIEPYGLGEEYRRFVQWIRENDLLTDMLPFVLGFTASYSFDRWFGMFNCMYWPDNAVHLFNAFVETSRLTAKEERRLRNTVARYIAAAYILICRDISVKVRKRFPTKDHLVQANVLTSAEMARLECRLGKDACYYWVPLHWIMTIVRRTRRTESTVLSDYRSLSFCQEIQRMRGILGDLLSYDWVPIPLAFIQIITAIVYCFSIVTVFSLQAAILSNHEAVKELTFSFYLTACWSVLSSLSQIIFYLGWLKSVHVIVNPFGDDDDDFEMDWLVDRHCHVVLETMMEMEDPPPLEVEHLNNQLPHTVASALLIKKASDQPRGSVAHSDDMRIVDPVLRRRRNRLV